LKITIGHGGGRRPFLSANTKLEKKGRLVLGPAKKNARGGYCLKASSRLRGGISMKFERGDQRETSTTERGEKIDT